MSEQQLFVLTSKSAFTLEETELYELSQLAGLTIDPRAFKIMVDLLKMNVAPSTLVQALKMMRQQALAAKKQKQPIDRRQLAEKRTQSTPGHHTTGETARPSTS